MSKAAVYTHLLGDCVLIEPRVFEDDRGSFMEIFRRGAEGSPVADVEFVQGNVSVSKAGVMRGLHFQEPYGQGKLVSVLSGRAWDVAVDVRYGSPTFGQWTAVVLDAGSRRQFWIPRGFAHWFVALEDDTTLSYLCDATYHPETEFAVNALDPDLNIDWPIADLQRSCKDAIAPNLAEIPQDQLPVYAL